METAELITSLVEDGRSLATAASTAGLEAAVPTCPGWQVRDVLRHTGEVHRWATAFLVEKHTEYHPAVSETALDGAELVAWFREGHEALVDALVRAPDELRCWTFLPAPSPLSFWARRQAHETAIHRVDAESALGGAPSPLPPVFAADGIDELLTGFHARPKSRVRSEVPLTLRVRTTDTEDVWTVHITTDTPHTVRDGDGPVDCELIGTAQQLYLTLWNRLPLSTVTIDGDQGPALLWQERSAV
ncbi:maleylpyruvate isomerase family mycothiol-dependent enzyme [Streptomyces albipurpureus]|uniref:Maleylpyruvate isomerase family mycothiol-dependent enzyme n=1 Tax=Streptomyces albipurpureus TaxID=2897419 RepID=A0ABT0UU40_9ACTN|nr:maleylpyruvate isomerase family mycothiol-dependent enzyme [Streptomyces sp. CWNU-1]MCM2390731.1 maleylpyruvate isomerase family mycothiol-dependent enzyme [Streptomyces sp. CWNU-1]